VRLRPVLKVAGLYANDESCVNGWYPQGLNTR